MKEIKLTIDGKEVQLTDEQLRLLGIETKEKRKNPFERVSEGERYFCTTSNGADGALEEHDAFDDDFFENADYFNDKYFANQVALHQLLYRKLLKYSYDNGFEDKEWDGNNVHVCIIYNFTRGDYDVRWTRDEKEPGTVYFKSTTYATAAINEVVMPFVKEHPDFVW